MKTQGLRIQSSSDTGPPKKETACQKGGAPCPIGSVRAGIPSRRLYRWAAGLELGGGSREVHLLARRFG